MKDIKHRKKQKLPKFLEIDELNKLEEPLTNKAKLALEKGKGNMTETDKIAIRDFALLSLLYACALRISEATNLKLHNLLLDKAQVIIIDSKGDDRIVDIPLPIIDILKEWLEIRPSIEGNNYVFTRVKGSTKSGEFASKEALPIRRQYYNNLIKKLAQKTGVFLRGGQELQLPHPHTMRHSRAMAIRDEEVEIEIIQKILGHKDLRNTQIYAHARREEIRNIQMNNTKGIVTLK